MVYLAGIFYWLFVVISMVILFFPAMILWLVTLPFDRKRKVLQAYTCWWGSLYTLVHPYIRVEVEGREHLKKGQCYVICANHVSLLDIPLCYRLNAHFKWISKKEIFRVPFMGWNMFLNGYIPLDRNRPSSHMKMMKKGLDYLKKGNSLLIFPEGSRQGSGTMAKFRDGAFLLAQKSKRNILPLLIQGSHEPVKGGMLFLKKVYHLKLTILPEISHQAREKYKDLATLTRDSLLQEQRDNIQKG